MYENYNLLFVIYSIKVPIHIKRKRKHGLYKMAKAVAAPGKKPGDEDLDQDEAAENELLRLQKQVYLLSLFDD